MVILMVQSQQATWFSGAASYAEGPGGGRPCRGKGTKVLRNASRVERKAPSWAEGSSPSIAKLLLASVYPSLRPLPGVRWAGHSRGAAAARAGHQRRDRGRGSRGR